jgi:peroxiredoxin
MRFDRRLVALLAAAATIAALCAWRVASNRPQDYASQLQQAKFACPAPLFEALDAHNEMFRLERYLGRHQILVIFYDAEDTAAADRSLLAARQLFDKLSQRDIKVVGVSTALPQQNRSAMEHSGEFPFPLVTDVDLTIHRRWGRLSATTNRPLAGAFLIDRKGLVGCLGNQPLPIDNMPEFLSVLAGESQGSSLQEPTQ